MPRITEAIAAAALKDVEARGAAVTAAPSNVGNKWVAACGAHIRRCSRMRRMDTPGSC